MTMKVKIINTSNWQGEAIEVHTLEKSKTLQPGESVDISMQVPPGSVKVFLIPNVDGNKHAPFKDLKGKQVFPAVKTEFVHDIAGYEENQSPGIEEETG